MTSFWVTLLTIIIVVSAGLAILYYAFLVPYIASQAQDVRADTTEDIKVFIVKEADKRISELRPQIERQFRNEIQTRANSIRKDVTTEVNTRVKNTEAEIRASVESEIARIEQDVNERIDIEAAKTREAARQEVRDTINQRIDQELRKLGLAQPKGRGCLIGAQCKSGKCSALKCA